MGIMMARNDFRELERIRKQFKKYVDEVIDDLIDICININHDGYPKPESHLYTRSMVIDNKKHGKLEITIGRPSLG